MDIVISALALRRVAATFKRYTSSSFSTPFLSFSVKDGILSFYSRCSDEAVELSFEITAEGETSGIVNLADFVTSFTHLYAGEVTLTVGENSIIANVKSSGMESSTAIPFVNADMEVMEKITGAVVEVGNLTRLLVPPLRIVQKQSTSYRSIVTIRVQNKKVIEAWATDAHRFCRMETEITGVVDGSHQGVIPVGVAIRLAAITKKSPCTLTFGSNQIMAAGEGWLAIYPQSSHHPPDINQIEQKMERDHRCTVEALTSAFTKLTKAMTIATDEFKLSIADTLKSSYATDTGHKGSIILNEVDITGRAEVGLSAKYLLSLMAGAGEMVKLHFGGKETVVILTSETIAAKEADEENGISAISAIHFTGGCMPLVTKK